MGLETTANEEGRLFRHFVCRIAGLPIGHLDALRAERTLATWGETRRLDAELEALRGSLIDALFDAVGGLEDRSLRTALVELKRAVHNRRRPKDAHLRRIEGQVVAGLAADLARFRELADQREAALAAAHKTFESEAVDLRRRFQVLVGDDDFRKGILLSTHTLFDELPRYTRAAPEKPGSKARQVERSLMRYFSRAAAKTTPFSTLCTLAAGHLDKNAGGAGVLHGDPRVKTSGLRLNKGVYAFLSEHFLRRPAIRRRLDVELNPTLRDEGEAAQVFLTAVQGREVFQRMPRNPVLDLLREMLAERPHRPFGDLLEALRTHPDVEATDEEAAAYVDRLIEVGFLRFRIGIREQEVDWDRPLAEILGAIDDEHAARIVRFLGEYRAIVDAYATSSVERRRELLINGKALLVELFEDLEVDRKPVGDLPPFYEDAGGDVRLELDLEPMAEVLSEWVRLTVPVVWVRGEQINMRAFFDRFYDSSDSVELLRFYEDFYREHFKGHLERLNQGRPARPPGGEAGDEGREDPENDNASDYDASNPFQLDVIREIDAARSRLVERVRELWQADPEAEEIRLERADLEAALGGLADHPEPCRSVSFFAQQLPGRDGAPVLVANNYLGGYGKYFSRFLHVLPDEIEAELRASNLELTSQDLAEICGDANFNANLHPPLLPREVSYPTGESGAAGEQIRTSELRVEPDPGNPSRLRLRQQRDGPRGDPDRPRLSQSTPAATALPATVEILAVHQLRTERAGAARGGRRDLGRDPGDELQAAHHLPGPAGGDAAPLADRRRALAPARRQGERGRVLPAGAALARRPRATR